MHKKENIHNIGRFI